MAEILHETLGGLLKNYQNEKNVAELGHSDRLPFTKYQCLKK